MRYPYRTTVVTLVAVVLLTGCSTTHHFQLLLTAKNADTGEPIEGVTGVLTTWLGSEEQKEDLDFGFPVGKKTTADGQLDHEFMVSPYPSNTAHWYLKLKKEGFEPVVIDIKPDPQPKKSDQATPLPITVAMKPLRKKP